jgi:hypothetical protein
MADRRHPEHREMRRWAGGRFDPEWFDLTMADKDVRAALTGKRRICMHQPLTKRSQPRAADRRTLQLLQQPTVDA